MIQARPRWSVWVGPSEPGLQQHKPALDRQESEIVGALRNRFCQDMLRSYQRDMLNWGTARMPSREYYLQQAKLLFEMAAATTDRAAVARLVARANEYLVLAEALAHDPPGAGQRDAPVQQQAQQQQQQQQQAQSPHEPPPKPGKGPDAAD
jgi:hypothetical protein